MGVPETPQPGLAGEQSQLPHFLCRGFWAWKASAQWVGLGVSRRSWDLGKGAAWEVLMWMDLLSWPLPSALSGLAPGSPSREGGPRSLFFSILPLPLGELWRDDPRREGTEMCRRGSLHQRGPEGFSEDGLCFPR